MCLTYEKSLNLNMFVMLLHTYKVFPTLVYLCQFLLYLIKLNVPDSVSDYFID